MMKATSNIKIALIGNPNCGKSSIFNRLTGLQQKVGNFAGVTVEKHIGECNIDQEKVAEITDLPGAYSLYPNSSDEKIVLHYLLDNTNPQFPDLILYVADASQLDRHLLLFSQIKDLKIPSILVLNMIDVAESKGLLLDIEQLSEALNTQIVCTNSRTGKGIAELKSKIAHFNFEDNSSTNVYDFTLIESEIEKEIIPVFPSRNAYERLLVLHHHKEIQSLNETQKREISRIAEKYQFKPLEHQINETLTRFSVIEPLVQKLIQKKSLHGDENNITQTLDKFLVHPLWGTIIFIGIMLAVFQAVFSFAQIPMDFIESQMNALSAMILQWKPNNVIANLIANGLLSGLTGVLVFVPQIAILFFFISLLEEIGYMSRTVYLFDGMLQKIGLNGRSIIALVSGGACAIPAILSTRTIQNWKERLITIFITPFIACSARIPVFAMLIAIIFPNNIQYGIFSLQSIAFTSLYFIGIAAAILAAYVMHKIIPQQQFSFLALEIPEYKMPHWKNVFITVWNKVKTFVREAGKTIIVVSILLWIMANFSLPNRMKQAEEKALTKAKTENLSEEETQKLVSTYQLQNSFAGLLGRAIEPVIRPLGFDWKIGIAIISSFAAREVFVGTMNTLYSIENGNNKSLRAKLSEEKYEDGKPVFTIATCISLLLFYVFAMQCIGTLAVVKQETNSWKFPLIQFTVMGALAYFFSFMAFQLLK